MEWNCYKQQQNVIVLGTDWGKMKENTTPDYIVKAVWTIV